MTTNKITAGTESSSRLMNKKHIDNSYSSYVFDLRKDDCLLGRGAPLVNYIGNVRYRELVQERGSRYATATDHRTKSTITHEIIQAIEQRNGRFLRRARYPDDVQEFGPWPSKTASITEGGEHSSQNSYVYEGVWIPLKATGPVVVAKIKQSLRECAITGNLTAFTSASSVPSEKKSGNTTFVALASGKLSTVTSSKTDKRKHLVKKVGQESKQVKSIVSGKSKMSRYKRSNKKQQAISASLRSHHNTTTKAEKHVKTYSRRNMGMGHGMDVKGKQPQSFRLQSAVNYQLQSPLNHCFTYGVSSNASSIQHQHLQHNAVGLTNQSLVKESAAGNTTAAFDQSSWYLKEQVSMTHPQQQHQDVLNVSHIIDHQCPCLGLQFVPSLQQPMSLVTVQQQQQQQQILHPPPSLGTTHFIAAPTIICYDQVR